MTILGLIAARGGSKGIPGKNLKLLAGKQLIEYSAVQAYVHPVFDDVVISTDDKDIYALCDPDFVVQMRPPELATDTASKWDVFRYVAKQNNLKHDDILVDLDTGCPLRVPEDITACVEKLQAGHFDVVATAYEAERNPYFNMVIQHGEGVEVVCEDEYHNLYGAITRRQDAPEVWSLSPAVFAIRAGALLAFDHWSQARLGIVVIPRERAWDIDSPLDFEIVEFLMKRKG